MLRKLKDGGVSFYLTAFAGLVALASFILFCISCSVKQYPVNGGGAGIALGAIGLLAVAYAAAATVLVCGRHWSAAVARLFGVGLLMAQATILLLPTISLASALFTWDPSNTLGWHTFSLSAACIVMLVIAALTLVVSAFFGEKSKICAAANVA